MSNPDPFDTSQGSPLPAPQSLSSSLHFSRPGPRGKRSTNDLKSKSSRASMRQQQQSLMPVSDANSSSSHDHSFDRSISPAPSALSGDLSADLSQLSLPRSFTYGSGIHLASEALQKLMSEANEGTFAAGALGQKLLDHQERMRQYMQQLEELSEQDNSRSFQKDNSNILTSSPDPSSSTSQLLLEQIQSDITRMKKEQQDLLTQLLQASNVDMGAIGISATTRAEAEAIITQTYGGGGIPESNSYNSVSATPTKPTSSNARELRRQRNAAAPNLNKDEVLVNDIQQQLINELRRLQALVAERDKALAAMNESLEEAARLKAMQETNIKKLEMEKDAKDASLYDAETKEAVIREENEEITRQLKRNENEVRLLKRQLGEKSDVAESLKLANEDLEQRVEDVLGSVATLKAKGAADQMLIHGLKVQVGDLEVKQRQAINNKIPSSMSTLSSALSFDHGSMDSMHDENVTIGPNGPAGRRSGAHEQALSPSASVDDTMMKSIRPSEAIKGLEADLAKWKAAAMKYRKKWSDERRQSTIDGNGKAQEYDDSTDEDEATWMDEQVKAGGNTQKRSASIRSRLVSSTSIRRATKTMGDAFGFGKGTNRITSSSSTNAWQEEGSEGHDNSLLANVDIDDGASSNAASSPRGSMDGFDPYFADPTIRSGDKSKAFKRRSTYTPASVAAAKGSPLARQLHLQDDEKSGDDSGSIGNDHTSSIVHQSGALGVELGEAQSVVEANEANAKVTEELREQHKVTLEAALVEKEQELKTALLEQEEELQVILNEKVEHFESLLQKRDIALQDAITQREQTHQAAIVQRDGAHQDQIKTLQGEHADLLGQQATSHTKAIAQLQERHSQSLAILDAEHESILNNLTVKNEEKIRDVTSRLIKQREEAMADARNRHTEALSKAREELQAELIAAQTEHKRMMDEKEKNFANEKERSSMQHERLVAQMEQSHKDHIDDLNATHELFYRNRDDAFGKVLGEKEDLLASTEKERQRREKELKSKEGEISSLKNLLVQLEKELNTLKQQQQTSREHFARQSQALREAQEQISMEKEQRKEAENRYETMSASFADRKMSLDTADEFQDARDTITYDRGFDADDTIRAQAMMRQDTTSTSGTGALETPLETPPLGLVMAKDLKETSSQTDDEMWVNYQKAQMDSILPPLNIPPPQSDDSAKSLDNSNRKVDKADDTTRGSQEMPPPASVPTKAGDIPSKPISDPSNDIFSNAQQSKLKVPEQQQVVTSKPSSRANRPPPSAYVDPTNGASRTSRVSTGGKGVNKVVSRPSLGTKRDTADTDSIASVTSARRGNQPSARAPSAMSFASGYTSDASRASGVSSRASDYRDGQRKGGERSMIVGPGNAQVTTDPIVLNSITQTMIGEYLYKYTRRSMGRSGHSDKRHQRYFWVHPYTRTLYWTLQAPSEAVSSENVNKSAFIQDVLVVGDHNNTPPNLYHMSILIMTQAREVKITAPTKEKHDLWVTALSYLVNRDMGKPAEDRIPSEWRQTISRASGTPSRVRSRTSGPAAAASTVSGASLKKRPSLLSPARSFATLTRRNMSTEQVDSQDRTPRARGQSLGIAGGRASTQRNNTAAKEYLESWEALNNKHSSRTLGAATSITTTTTTSTNNQLQVKRPPVKSIKSGRRSALSARSEDILPDGTDVRMMTPEQLIELSADENEGGQDGGYEGLENVRACCNGKHDVGDLAHKNYIRNLGGVQGGRKSTSRMARTSTASIAGSSMRSSVKSKGNKEDGPLRLTGNGAPQLGPLSLNTLHTTTTTTGDNNATIKGRDANKIAAGNDWFAGEFGSMVTSKGSAPAVPEKQKVSSPLNPKLSNPSYSDRIAQIRKAKSPLLR